MQRPCVACFGEVGIVFVITPSGINSLLKSYCWTKQIERGCKRVVKVFVIWFKLYIIEQQNGGSGWALLS